MDKIAVLKGVSLFSGLDPQTLEQLASIAEERTYKAGEQIYTEGESDATLFILTSGVVKIDKQVSAEQQQTLQQVQAEQFLGEVSFVRGGEHIATAQVVHDADVLMIRRVEFDRLAARQPAVGYKIMLRMAAHLATMLRSMDEKFVELVSYIYGRSKK